MNFIQNPCYIYDSQREETKYDAIFDSNLYLTPKRPFKSAVRPPNAADLSGLAETLALSRLFTADFARKT